MGGKDFGIVFSYGFHKYYIYPRIQIGRRFWPATRKHNLGLRWSCLQIIYNTPHECFVSSQCP